MSTESAKVEQWLYSMLTSDQELTDLVGDKVFAYVAPEDVDCPFVVYNLISALDYRTLGPYRYMVNLLYQVKCIDKGFGLVRAHQIADRIDEVLEGANGTVDSIQIATCYRDGSVAYTEVDDKNNVYRHVGGMYRIVVLGGQ